MIVTNDRHNNFIVQATGEFLGCELMEDRM
jgi:hypothetical protein